MARPAESRSPLELLTEAADALLAEDAERVPAAELGGDLLALRRQIDRLEAAFAARLSRFDRLRCYLADGATSAVAWLRTHCGLSGGGAHARTEVSRELAALPDASELFAAGVISLDSAAVLARTVTEVGPQAAAAAAPVLVAAALSQDPGELRLTTRELRYEVDGEGAAAAFERCHAQRFLHLTTTRDGACRLDGLLDPEAGARVRTCIDALTAPIRNDQRSAGQRNADALAELCTRQMDSGTLPRRGGQRPHLVLRATRAQLRGEPGEKAPTLDGVGAIPVATAQRLACDAAVSEITLDVEGSPLDAGRTRRSSSAKQHRAVVERDRCCVVLRCGRGPEWCDVHHVDIWDEGGKTDVKVMALVCRAHHRMIHEGGWRMTRNDDGSFSVRPPP